MVGELEGRKRLGTRSRFIKESIRAKLNKIEEASLNDWPELELIYNLQRRLDDEGKKYSIEFQLLELIGEKMRGELE